MADKGAGSESAYNHQTLTNELPVRPADSVCLIRSRALGFQTSFRCLDIHNRQPYVTDDELVELMNTTK